jgi:hypothetical protein
MLLHKAESTLEEMLPKKKSVEEIARDFRLLVKVEPDVWKFGISHDWLSDHFDLSRLPQAEDLPRHARIGIGIHAGQVNIEEISLLEDTFFLLVRARRAFKTLMLFAESRHPESGSRAFRDRYRGVNALNSSVCTYSRLGVLTAAAFVEAFVNSVGWNEMMARPDFSEEEKAELQGIRNGRYLNLESKLERMLRVIRSDKVSPIILSDKKQMREPFISFLRDTKTVRDASMHYAPGKGAILHPPGEWLQLVEAAAKQSVAVAREFWSACYPGRRQPRYLASLHYDGLQQQAFDRLAAAKLMMENEHEDKCKNE